MKTPNIMKTLKKNRLEIRFAIQILIIAIVSLLIASFI